MDKVKQELNKLRTDSFSHGGSEGEDRQEVSFILYL